MVKEEETDLDLRWSFALNRLTKNGISHATYYDEQAIL
ncbi:hypothetical protein OPV22_022978 [Ensete ventricosum]|uniref:Uncharacterized protein n=1 Tax=Ensete ventricosum TaxID=4639 RepID=A0AAV8PEQ1_ENSVE|nr:hypothetical protein OPV22_022978 [Ensete ventricosum]